MSPKQKVLKSDVKILKRFVAWIEHSETERGECYGCPVPGTKRAMEVKTAKALSRVLSTLEEPK